MRLRERVFILLPWLLLGAFFLFTLFELRRAYLSRGFNYHDLGLVSDFMTAVWHGRGLFHVFDAGINHLGWLFTPTLVLFTPLHAICDSQFTLVVWLTFATFGGYAVLLATLRLLLVRAGAFAQWPWVGMLFAVFAGISTYCWKVNTSAHYESVYLLFASAVLYGLLSGERPKVMLPLYLLCLGSRPDAGIFLSLQLMSLLALPKSFLPAGPAFRRWVVCLTVGGLVYTLLVIKVISPAFGIGEKTHALRLWSHYGDSFETIALHIITRPSALWESLKGGAFLKLNQSLLLLPLFHPVGWIANLPGFIFYTTGDPSHRTLEFYNAALLVPGLFLGAFAGLVSLMRALEQKPARGKSKRRFQGNTAVLATLIALAAVSANFPSALRSFRALTDETNAGGVSPEEGRRQIAWIRELLASCPKIRSVSADFQTSTWVPNRVGIAMLRNADKADAVIFNPNARPFLAGADSLAEFERALPQRGPFALYRETPGLKAFVRAGICAGG